MKLFFLLGNQLFSEKYLEKFRKDHIFFMAEDYQLCTYEKHHKQKILLFLCAMRSHAELLRKKKFKIEYSSIEDKSFKQDYTEKLKKFIKLKVPKIKTASKAIGIAEIREYLKKKIEISEVIEKISIKTRQYAKRQSTWGRGYMMDWNKIKSEDLNKFLKKI